MGSSLDDELHFLKAPGRVDEIDERILVQAPWMRSHGYFSTYSVVPVLNLNLVCVFGCLVIDVIKALGTITKEHGHLCFRSWVFYGSQLPSVGCGFLRAELSFSMVWLLAEIFHLKRLRQPCRWA